jgi:hypothetical protein
MRSVFIAACTVGLGGCGIGNWLISGLPGGGGGGGGLPTDTGREDTGWQDTGVDEPTGETGDVILDCNTDAGYEVDTSVWEVQGEPTLWLASVYEASVGNGAATVDFTLPGSHVLALSSYESVDWTVSVGPDTELTGIYVFGYEPSTVSAPRGVPVVIVPQSGCGYSLPYNGGGCDTDDLLAEVESTVGLPVHRFDGCYDASTVVYEPAEDVVTEGVPCGPGERVELSFPISAIDMSLGASDESGPGVCRGVVEFSTDLDDVQILGTMLEGQFAQVPFNGWGDNTCGEPHCNTLVYGDGRERDEYCTVVGVCEDGVARATGYTW